MPNTRTHLKNHPVRLIPALWILITFSGCSAVLETVEDNFLAEETVQGETYQPMPAILGPEENTPDEERTYQFARTQFFLKNFPIAEYYLKKTLFFAPDHPEALRLLPWAYFFQKRYDRALVAFGKAQARYPRQADPLIGMGWSYLSLEFYELALKTFKRAQKFAPDSYQVHKGLGFTYLFLKQEQEAHQELSKIFDIDQLNSVTALWSEWSRQMPDHPPEVVNWDLEQHSLFRLPPEHPRYPGILFGWAETRIDPVLDEAWRLYKKHLLGRAQEMFEAAEQNSLDAQNGLAWTYLKSGQIIKARSLFHSILSTYPEFPGAVLGMQEAIKARRNKAKPAKFYYTKEKYLIAETEFNELAESYPEWSYPNTMLGWIDLKQKNEEEAFSHFNDAMDLNENDTQALEGLRQLEGLSVSTLFQGEQARKRKDYKGASYKYWEYIQQRGPGAELDKPLAQAYAGLAWSQIGKRQYDLALENFQRLEGMDGYEYQVTKGIGLSHYLAGRYSEALDYLNQADLMDPEDKEVSVPLDFAIFKSQDPRQAETILLRRIQERPLFSSSYMALGWVYYKNGRRDLGVDYFLRAISLQPDMAMNVEFIGMLQQERFGWEIYNRLGWEFYARNDYKNAEPLFQAALNRKTRSSEAMKGLGYIYFKRNSYKAAENYLKQALARNTRLDPVKEVVDSKNGDAPQQVLTSARTLMGQLLLKQNRPQEALKYYLEERSLNPTWPEVNEGLGWTYLKLNRLAEARSAFNLAIQYQPLNRMAQKGLRKVKRLQVNKNM